jgi:phosphoglycolate phosphatase-like HAD superfamily hydrolase
MRLPDASEVAACGLPELVVFDVDGTLQDTLAWWPEVARAGVSKLAEQIGVDLPPPDLETAWEVVGLPDSGVWTGLLPGELHDRWPELRDVTVPLEVEVLRSGRDCLFPGTAELLRWLREHGVRITLASNCGQTYFDAVLEGQGLGRLVDDAFCLDSPGISSKTEMVRAAIARAEPGLHVLVGDRESDREAAVANGIAFVHRVGFHDRGALPADASADSSEQLAEVLLGFRDSRNAPESVS